MHPTNWHILTMRPTYATEFETATLHQMCTPLYIEMKSRSRLILSLYCSKRHTQYTHNIISFCTVHSHK